MTDFKSYANSFQAVARLELEGIGTLLDFLSHPERKLDFIHVAGTNGKGSVCAFLQKMFTYAGFRCGKYISPNLVRVNERISIDDTEISDRELNAVLEKVEKASILTKEKLGTPPTQFEIWTAAAFCYFKEKKCDIVILETGLGGAQDATNIIPTPLASVITKISKDHTSYLGNTLSEIASQKAGIIKTCGNTVTLHQNPEIEEVIRNTCSKKNNTLYICEKPKIYPHEGMNEVISYRSASKLRVGIPGVHQIENACIAAEVAFRLKLPEEAVRFGIENAKNSGRLELIENNPPMIFDGAHNPDGVASLVVNLKRYFPHEVPVFIFAAMADKDITEIAQKLFGKYKTAVVYTTAVSNNPRSESAEGLAEALTALNINAVPKKNFAEAYAAAKMHNKLTVICGSLYLYKDLKEMQSLQ